MAKQKTNLIAEQTTAMDKYEQQRDVIADVFCKKMNKRTITGNMSMGFTKGVLVGGVFAILLSYFNAKLSEYNEMAHVTHAKSGNNHTKHMIVCMIAIVTLASLIESGLTTVKECNQNKDHANKLANDTIKRYFERPLSKYNPDTNTTFRATRAAAIIISNMPTHELQQLQDLAKTGLVETNDVFVRNSAIAEASTLISDYLNSQPALEKIVSQIMNGQDPKTYILTNATQRVK